MTATAQPKYHAGLGPLVAGFTYCPFGDLQAVRDSINDQTCAIMIEPIQGEGGVQIPPEGFLQGLRDLCDENDLRLIFDEVQVGCGRTGEWFAHQYFNVEPDIMTLAKSLCGGIAGGAMLARPEIAVSLKPGTHAATFGGNPIAAAAGIAAIETIEEEGLLDEAKALSKVFETRANDLVGQFEFVKEVRVAGLMIGIELDIEGAPVVAQCMNNGLLINCTQGNILRLLPAMNVGIDDANRGMDLIAEALQAVGREAVEA
ncbi:MAG: aminotransferase class III-fold pyridoxal phosphate-dependent enzyme [Pirellulaceae bacterium]